MMNLKYFGLALGLLTALVGCTSIPKGLKPVSNFDVERYLGTWYEIARLDHSFEKNLTNVSADYAQNEDGTISVTNRGYNTKKAEWKDIQGKAKFIGNESIGSLKVSFFGPFYGGYHVIALDQETYHYAMVAGPSRSYLWILSRAKTLDQNIYMGLVSQAENWGFDTSPLIKVEQGGEKP
jgi:apolipoprotein D and lipocalin family protein